MLPLHDCLLGCIDKLNCGLLFCISLLHQSISYSCVSCYCTTTRPPKKKIPRANKNNKQQPLPDCDCNPREGISQLRLSAASGIWSGKSGKFSQPSFPCLISQSTARFFVKPRLLPNIMTNKKNKTEECYRHCLYIFFMFILTLCSY